MDTTVAFVTAHWPFFAVTLTLWVIGHFMERSVFTEARERQYQRPAKGQPDKRTTAQKFHHWFFYWGRESMELHPLFTGFLIGLAWLNPEGADPAWGRVASAVYFTFAGACSLVGWKIAVMILGRFGVQLPPDGPKFPGER